MSNTRITKRRKERDREGKERETVVNLDQYPLSGVNIIQIKSKKERLLMRHLSSFIVAKGVKLWNLSPNLKCCLSFPQVIGEFF